MIKLSPLSKTLTLGSGLIIFSGFRETRLIVKMYRKESRKSKSVFLRKYRHVIFKMFLELVKLSDSVQKAFGNIIPLYHQGWARNCPVAFCSGLFLELKIFKDQKIFKGEEFLRIKKFSEL